jgi:signal transduction histidine kinase
VLESNTGGFSTNKIIDNISRAYGFSRLTGQPLMILVGVSNDVGMENYLITSKMYVTIATLFTFCSVLLSICCLVFLVRQKKLTNSLFYLNKRIKENDSHRLKDLSDLSRTANLNISKIVNKYNYLISQVNSQEVSIEINRIKDSLHEITDLIFSKLIRVKIDSNEFKTENSNVLLDEVISTVLENFKNKLSERNIELFFNIEPGFSEYIKVDKICLVKIIKILISNAVLQCKRYETLALNIKSSHDKKFINFTLDAKMLESDKFITDAGMTSVQDVASQEDVLFLYADLDLAKLVSEKINGTIYLNEMHKLKFYGFQIPLQFVEGR